jgi:PAS domain-containing protein
MLDADDRNAICLVVTDLTEQKYHEKLVAAQEALQVSEEEYRTTFELAGVGKVQIDAASGRFHRVNARFCDMLHYSRDELLSLTFADVSFPDDREHVADLLARLTRGSEADSQRSDGSSARTAPCCGVTSPRISSVMSTAIPFAASR